MPGQLLGDLSADSFRGAGDDGDLSDEFFHWETPLVRRGRARVLRQP